MHAALRRKMKTTRTVKVNNSTNINKTNNHLKSMNIKNPHQMTLEIHVQAWARHTNAGYPVSGIPNWLVWNRNHASEWSDRCTIGLMFKWSWSSTLKGQLSVSVLYKADIVISSKWNSKQITHSFNLWSGELCMRHPYKTWCEF